jgi:hypothetical protein
MGLAAVTVAGSISVELAHEADAFSALDDEPEPLDPDDSLGLASLLVLVDEPDSVLLPDSDEPDVEPDSDDPDEPVDPDPLEDEPEPDRLSVL